MYAVAFNQDKNTVDLIGSRGIDCMYILDSTSVCLASI